MGAWDSLLDLQADKGCGPLPEVPVLVWREGTVWGLEGEQTQRISQQGWCRSWALICWAGHRKGDPERVHKRHVRMALVLYKYFK